MLRYVTLVLLPTLTFLLAPVLVEAQERPIPGAGGRPSITNGLSGIYVNQETGGFCSVYRMGRDYLFVDESAQRVPFAYSGNGQLRSFSMNGIQAPDISVTVTRDARGRIVLRFDAPGVPSGYWVSAS